ncbi:EAL and HDOD domain-containing protein [Agaribacter marinus]|uniref:Diguanylate phosphodiesterase n=1 Tax=Agaribacter marinus TaxID=1431249 RepID=A0AA37WKZ5_9ALTE|nr:HDOD domain-containing protein [Agaribacter marinus]GLR72019.1 diguanylate phosphodiesterase [Agaribacter marinus]
MALYTARQPILDTSKNLVGYELLFRSSLDNVFPNVDEEKATSKMIEGLHIDMGLDRISNGKTAFINFTKQSLLNDYAELLPKEKVTIEILESVRPTKAVYVKMKTLSDAGYSLALDDFIHSEYWEPFYKLCKTIKVDCLQINDEQLADICAVAKRHSHLQLLAEKVEDAETFQKYKALGFDLFQGYFFAKPEVIKSVSLSNSQSLLSTLLNETSKVSPNINKITEIFELDPSLSFKLLRYAQSPIFQRRKKIDSIKQALVMLGSKELERFIMLLFAATFSENKPTELIRLSLQRAKFCEELAEITNSKEKLSAAFLAGMLSLLDAMLDADLASVISKLPLSDEIKIALVRHQGDLANYLNLCRSCEKGDWDAMEEGCTQHKVSLDVLSDTFFSAGTWAEERVEALT